MGVALIDPIDGFREAILAAGLNPPDDLVGDGRVRRFSSSGRRGDDAGWYVLHLDSVPAGAFGCWRSGQTSQWCSRSLHSLSPSESEIYRRRLEDMRQQREADKHARQQQAREFAMSRWQNAATVLSHPYLEAKDVQAYDLKADGDELLIPMRDASGVLQSLQAINAGGVKRFQYGGQVKGAFHLIGQPSEVLVLCEGYATGASIYQATGYAVAVAFTAGNLQAVAKELHHKYPNLRLVVAADDDWKTEGNPGLTKAMEVVSELKAWLAVPQFPNERPINGTDFNDLHRLVGLVAVRLGIDAAVQVKPDAQAGSKINIGAARPRSEVMLINGAELKPEPVHWLWNEWLALGKLHILAGAPGQGKTTIALSCAATVTQGGRWPDGSQCDAGNVLIWSGEDDPADTLLPRLLAAGAEKGRCYFVGGTRIDDAVEPFDPSRDLAALEAQAERIGGIKLLIVDPVVSAVTGDSHKNTEVRRALQPLVDLASRLNIAVLGISHFSKGGAGGDPAARVVGSIAFTAVARVVLVAAKVKGENDVPDRRILARGKSNIGPDEGGFEYSIEQGEPIPGICASYIVWGNSVSGTARDLFAEHEATNESKENVSALRGAEDFLIEILNEGPSPTKYLEERAKEAGVSWRTVRRASETLGVRKTKVEDAWYWRKP